MTPATSPLTSDDLDLRRVPPTAEQAMQLRRYASGNGRAMPISQRGRELYAVQALEPPQL